MSESTKPHVELSDKTKRMVLQDYLHNKSEVDFMKEVLCPLMEAMGYEKVHFNHGPGELGKDIIAVERDRLGGSRYTALVVKNDDIKNTSAAKATLQEVLRQVNQAWRNPIELLNFPKAPPSEVWVVTSGRFSNTAEAEIKQSVQDFNAANTKFVDQDQLIGLIDRYYPQLFFHRMPLLAQYLCDLAEHLKAATKLDTAEASFFGRMDVMCFRNSTQVGDTTIRTDTKKTIDTLRPGEVTWLQGGTGSGKTFTLYRAIQNDLEILRQPRATEMDSQVVVPIYLKASDFVGVQADQLTPEFLFAKVKKYSSVAFDDFQKWLKHSRLLIVVDEFERLQKVEAVDRLYKTYIAPSSNKNTLLLLSRMLDEFSFKFSFKPNVWCLSDLNMAQAVKIIDQVIPADNQRARSAFKELQQNGVLERIPRTPLALNVLSYVFSAGISNTPNNTCEFFDMFFSIVLGRWEGQRDTQKTFDYQQVRSFLQATALFIIENNTTEIEIGMLSPIAERILQGVNEKRITPDEFVRKVAEIADVVQINGTKLSFTHRTYLEFLAGCEYAQYRWQIADVLEKIVDLNWEDSLIFAAGFRRRDEELLKCVEKIPEANSRDQFLKVKNIAFLIQALYQTELDAKVHALKVGANSATVLRDNSRMAEGLKKVFVGISEVGISLINLKLFSMFYGRTSLGTALLKALEANNAERSRYYLLGALCGADLDSTDLEALEFHIDSFEQNLEDKEGVALPWFVNGEKQHLNSTALVMILESPKFKKMAKRALDFMRPPERPQSK